MRQTNIDNKPVVGALIAVGTLFFAGTSEPLEASIAALLAESFNDRMWVYIVSNIATIGAFLAIVIALKLGRISGRMLAAIMDVFLYCAIVSIIGSILYYYFHSGATFLTGYNKYLEWAFRALWLTKLLVAGAQGSVWLPTIGIFGIVESRATGLRFNLSPPKLIGMFLYFVLAIAFIAFFSGKRIESEVFFYLPSMAALVFIFPRCVKGVIRLYQFADQTSDSLGNQEKINEDQEKINEDQEKINKDQEKINKAINESLIVIRERISTIADKLSQEDLEAFENVGNTILELSNSNSTELPPITIS